MSLAPGPPASLLAFDDDSSGTPLAAAAPPQPNPIAWISFAGGSNESAASFLQSVQRIAFLQNRVEDDKWIAQYAATCFTDLALVWFYGLDEETQSSWKKLRMAVIQRFPPHVIAQPKPAGTSSGTRSSATKRTDIGRIEVIRPELGDLFGYLSQDSEGEFVVDPSQEKALRFQKVLHTDSKQQNQKIYSLKVLNAPNPRFPFVGLKLFKFTSEDPDTVPLTDPRAVWSQRAQDVPSCCKMTPSFSSLQLLWRSPIRARYATWSFAQTTESGPGPYYMRKAQSVDQNARVVSAVWTILDSVNHVEALGLVWPKGDDSRPSEISNITLEAVLHKGGSEGLHVHAARFTKGTPDAVLDESHVVLLFKQTPNT